MYNMNENVLKAFKVKAILRLSANLSFNLYYVFIYLLFFL